MNKFSIGDKVVPVDKTAGTAGLGSSQTWHRAKANNQPYIYITATNKSDCDYWCSDEEDSTTGDFFNESDLIPYVEKLKYKVGQKLRILDTGRQYRNRVQCGDIVTIESIETDKYGDVNAFFKETGGKFRLITEHLSGNYKDHEGDYFEIVKEFVLPSKWCIKQNVSQIVCDWFKQHPNTRSANINGGFTYLAYDGTSSSYKMQQEDYIEITLEQFKKHVMQKQFPTKWCIQGCEELKQYACCQINGRDRADIMGNQTNYYYYRIGTKDNGAEKWGFTTAPQEEGYTIITFQEYQQHILKDMKETKEILGYKVPQDLFNGNIKAGWTLFKDADGKSYRPKGHGPLSAIPAEIVETWEPVYKEVPEFKVIPSTDGKYECSQCGIVRNHKTKKELSQSDSTKGYLKVNLWLNDKNISKVVHRLVAETWIDNPNNYECINHIDENKHNNNASNLEWCTIQYNNLQYRLNGGKYNSELTEADITDIYLNYNNYGEQILAAQKYNVTPGTITFIKNNKTHKLITDKLQ